MGDWCILRTAGRTTLSLAASLAEDGFEVWTPVETVTKRVPRMNARRTIRQAILPTYVFARAAHLVDLLQLAAMPVKPRRGKGLLQPAHGAFTVLHAFGKIPMVADRHFAELRNLEARRTPTEKAGKALTVGIGVRIKGGAAQGMKGTVERSTRAHTVVCINERYTVKIATCLLDPDELCGENIPAAKRAA